MSNAAKYDASELSELVRSSWPGRLGRGALLLAMIVVVGAVVSGVASVVPPQGVLWATGAILVLLVGATALLCLHAGSHAWFVPLPALILAVAWAVVVPGRQSPGGLGVGRPAEAWLLLALFGAAAGGAVMVGRTALRQRLRSLADPHTLVDSSGTAVTALDPTGVVRISGETWSATSLSGPLPAGAPVHVVRATGVRLEVWSEAGAVPDHRSLEHPPLENTVLGNTVPDIKKEQQR